MVNVLEMKMIEAEAARATAKITKAAQDDTLSWEEVSRIASEENARLLRSMELAERTAHEFVEESTAHAARAGMFMFDQAKGSVDPEFIPDLMEGVNTLILRVRQQAEAGRILPMDWMDPGVRKAIFLVESYVDAGKKSM